MAISLRNKLSSKKIPIFYCPNDNCIYQQGSERYFSTKFSLKQHLLKVHTEKNFNCSKCEKAFPSNQQRTYHEKNCGIDWKCSCGLSYKMRESLLTHVRRTAHQLPKNIEPPKKFIQKPIQNLLPPTQIIILPHQTQLITNFNSYHASVTCSAIEQPKKIRKILPKHIIVDETNRFINPIEKLNFLQTAKKDGFTQTENKIKCNRHHIVHRSSMHSANQTTNTLQHHHRVIHPSAHHSSKRVAETQTSRRSILRRLQKNRNNPILRESRASQCTTGPFKAKRQLRSESIETQTENILAKMKRALNDKNGSVAAQQQQQKQQSSNSTSTSDSRVDVSAQSVLSYLDFLLESSKWNSTNSQQQERNSSETQTSPRGAKNSKLNGCHSTTFNTEDTMGQTEFGMLRLLATVCQRFKTQKESTTKKSMEENQLGITTTENWNNSDEMLPKILTTNNSNIINSLTANIQEPITTTLNEDMIEVNNAIEDCPSIHLEEPFTNIETQTSDEINKACAQLLTNMETQTTNDDELLFPELEISDTQTQTPWPDILDYCYNLEGGQLLSAEIQTDITGQDIPDYFTNWSDDMMEKNDQSFAVFTDTETQTQDSLLPMQELTSSYTQTLDEMCDFFLFQEKT